MGKKLYCTQLDQPDYTACNEYIEEWEDCRDCEYYLIHHPDGHKHREGLTRLLEELV